MRLGPFLNKYYLLALCCLSAVLIPHQANADSFSIGSGVMLLERPSRTKILISGEYEHRTSRLIGIGFTGNYVFTDPGIFLLAVPNVFLHPMGGDWYLNASPVAYFRSGSTDLGVRLGTRFSLPLGLLVLVPSFAVDFINGDKNYLVGVSIVL